MHPPRTDVIHQLVLEPLGPDAWRLCDRAAVESDLVAYIERAPVDGFEIVWVQGGRGITRHGSLDEILRVAVQRLQVPVISAGAKPAPIPHVPPLSVA